MAWSHMDRHGATFCNEDENMNKNENDTERETCRHHRGIFNIEMFSL